MTGFRFEEEQARAQWAESLLRDPLEGEKVLHEYLQRAMRAEQTMRQLHRAVAQTDEKLSALDGIAKTFYQSLPQQTSFFGKEDGEHYRALGTTLRLMQERADAVKGKLNGFPMPDGSDSRKTEAEMLFGYAAEMGEKIGILAETCLKELTEDRQKKQNILKNAAFCKEMMQKFLSRELQRFYERVLSAADVEGEGRCFRLGEIKSLFGEFLYRIENIKQLLNQEKMGG